MAKMNLKELNVYCSLFDAFAEIDGDKMLANIYYFLRDGSPYYWRSIKLV